MTGPEHDHDELPPHPSDDQFIGWTDANDIDDLYAYDIDYLQNAFRMGWDAALEARSLGAISTQEATTTT